jgi:hypothetical protein
MIELVILHPRRRFAIVGRLRVAILVHGDRKNFRRDATGRSRRSQSEPPLIDTAAINQPRNRRFYP